MKKLSARAEVILGVIREHTVIDEGAVKSFWTPLASGDVYEVYGRQLKCPDTISGSGDARIINMLADRGLVQMKPQVGPYACACTEDGILEYERIAQKRRGPC